MPYAAHRFTTSGISMLTEDLQAPHVPPYLAQCAQLEQVVQARHKSDPTHLPPALILEYR
jgi:hypothetical protein